MKHEVVNPEGWPRPSGYSNAIRADGAGSLVFMAGQIAWDGERKLVGAGDFMAQFSQALKNCITVLEAAGGKPEHVVRATVYVTDKAAYLDAADGVGAAWRGTMGKNYPAMSLVQVAALLEEGAMVEIECTAVLPDQKTPDEGASA